MKCLTTYLLLLVTFFTLFNANAQNSPAGIGNAYELNLWLSAEDISGVSDGDLMDETWTDRSGKNHHASQTTPANQPTFHESVINGYPVVRFDGNNDLLDNVHSYNARSVFVVYQMSSASQNTSHLAHLWGNYDDGVQVGPDARAGGNNRGFSFDGQTSSGTRARYAMNAAALTGYATNSNTQQWDYDQFEIVAVEFENTKTLTRQVLGSLYPNFSIGDHQLGGDIAEVIVFEDPIGPTQRALVENYLSSKYQLAISNDLYAYDISHGNDVAGIGRASSGNKQSEALSAGILGLKESDALAVNDFALLGHNNGAIDSWTSTGTPSGYSIERLGRSWRVDVSGATGESIVVLDTADLPTKSSSSSVWAVLTSSNGNFAANSEIHLLDLSAGKYESQAMALSDGMYIAIAAVELELDFTQSNFSAIESEDSIIISVKLNLPQNSDVSFTLQTSDSTAISPADYTAINGSYTIPAGDTLIQIGLQMVNDTIVEADEYIKLELTPDNTDIFEVKTSLATINDDDNPRKVSFQFASLSGSESIGNVSVNVVLNEVDSINSTTVKYRLKGGTASNGADFTLSAGTLTFPALSGTQSFDISVIDDTLYEGNETIIVELYDPTNSNLSDIEPIEFTYTIIDNDPAPQLNFPITNLSKIEGNYIVKIPVKLSAPCGTDVTYEYNLKGGTATLGSDFNFTAGTSSIAAGDVDDTISIQLLEDVITEIDETVLISINALSVAETGADSVFTLTIKDNDVFGFTGPGGVGDSALNVLWLDAGEITGISSGNAINTNWPDKSGNAHHATQSNASYQPTYVTGVANGLPVVRFDGNNDFFDNTYDYDAASGIVVLRVNSTTQNSSQLAQLFGNYNEGHFAVDPRSDNTRGMSFDGGTSENGRFRVNGGSYTPYNNDTNAEQWSYDEFLIITGNFQDVLSLSRMVIGSLYPAFSVGQHEFGGDIAEMIVFQNHLNDAHNNIIENYLAAKYDISISNDLYAYDATHPHDLIGIGQETANDIHISAKSGNILKLHNPQGLSDGDYIFAGHDNESIAAWTGTGAPNASTRILDRTWKLEASDTTAELSISIDTADLPTLPAGFAAWALLIDEDGDFTNGATYHLLETDINGEQTANDVKITTGDVVGIAAVKNISAQDGNFGSASTWVAGVPGSSDTAIIAANHFLTLAANATSAHIHLSRHARVELGSFTYSISEGSMEINGIMDMGVGTVSYAANGDQNIANVSYNNLRIQGTGTKVLTANTTVEGNLILDAATLDANNSGNYTLHVAGNWVNNGGSFNPRNAEVDLSGASTQGITTNGEAFYTLRVSGSGPYELQDDATVSNTLVLENGVLSTQSNTLIIDNNSGSAISSYSNASFVNGNLQRAVGIGFNEYIFPVGNGTSTTNYHPAEIASNNLLSVSNITAHFTDIERHDDLDMNVSDTWLDYQSISPDGMWVITPNQQPTAGTYNVKLFLDNMTGLTDNEFAVIKRPEGAADASAWTAPGSINVVDGLGRRLSDGYALRLGLTSFSEFGMGSGSDSGDPLPVELLYFDAYKMGEKAELEWVTVSEINSESFEVQRSANALDFETIGTLKAQGNSLEEVQYNFTDEKPLKGANYYRLKQLDRDGQFEIFPIKQLYFDGANEQVEVNIYPNPSDGKQLNIDLKHFDLDTKNTNLKIYDAQGKQVFELGNFASESNSVELNNNLSPGIYIIDIQIGKSSQKLKWIIN